MKSSGAKLGFMIFGALMVLTVVTVAASRVDMGVWNLPVALLIAGCKAALVLIYFMELRESENSVLIYAVGGILWLAIMLIFTFSDYLTRTSFLS